MSRLPVRTKSPRKKFCYVGAPAIFALQQACHEVVLAFEPGSKHVGCYVVGSALERPDWRDVDVRLIMDDEHFERTFPGAGRHWEWHARWLLLTVSISGWLSQRTGLPVDFQFQPMTHANERHHGHRNSIGHYISAGKPE